MNTNTGEEHEQKLPRGWSKGYSKSQKRWYYSHAETKHTQWHFPTASEVADPAKAKKRAAENVRLEKERMAKQKPTSSSSAHLRPRIDRNRRRHRAALVWTLGRSSRRPRRQPRLPTRANHPKRGPRLSSVPTCPWPIPPPSPSSFPTATFIRPRIEPSISPNSSHT